VLFWRGFLSSGLQLGNLSLKEVEHESSCIKGVLVYKGGIMMIPLFCILATVSIYCNISIHVCITQDC
jgi:hypothetical protein